MDVEDPTAGALSPVPVDLEMLADALEGDPLESGGVLDLDTGDVWPQFVLDGMAFDEEIERPLAIDNLGSRAAYEDMCVFIASLHDTSLIMKLTAAVQGRGAFRRFRDVLGEEDPAARESYFAMSRARKIDRAAAWLEACGYRAVDRPQNAG